MTFRAFSAPLIRLRDLPAGGPSGHSIQTDRLLLKAGLSAWENEGGAPVPPASDIEGKEPSPARRSGSITPGTILIEECYKLSHSPWYKKSVWSAILCFAPFMGNVITLLALTSIAKQGKSE